LIGCIKNNEKNTQNKKKSTVITQEDFQKLIHRSVQYQAKEAKKNLGLINWWEYALNDPMADSYIWNSQVMVSVSSYNGNRKNLLLKVPFLVISLLSNV
jgi:hypothetical protein